MRKNIKETRRMRGKYLPNRDFTIPWKGCRTKRASSWLLTVIQVTVCGVVIVAALALKVFGGDLYTNIRDWYVKQINNSIVAEEQADSFKTKVLELFPRASSAPESSEPESSASGTESS